jgi:hypothetical protein
MNYSELSYSELQAIAKQNNIKANQKKDALIVALNNLEKTPINEPTTVISFEGLFNVEFGTVKETVIHALEQSSEPISMHEITNNTEITETKKDKTTKKIQKQTANTPETKKQYDNIKVTVNAIPYKNIDNEKYNFCVYSWVTKAIEYFISNSELSTRIINTLPDIWNALTIDIQMTVKTQYKEIKNGYRTELVSIGQNQKPELNRKKTAFANNLISPPTSLENSRVNNSKDLQFIYWDLLDTLETIEINKDNEQYIKRNPDTTMYSKIEYIKVNGVTIIGSIAKLGTKLESDTKLKISNTNKVKSSIFGDYSLPFSYQLDENCKYVDKLGYDILSLEVRLEDNLHLNLYQIVDKHKSTDNYITHNRGNRIIKTTTSGSSVGRFVFTIATLTTREVSASQWISSQPQYEYIVKYLNSGNSLDTTITSKFTNISYNDDKTKLIIGDRVIATKKYLGKDILANCILHQQFCDKNGEVLDGCKWIDDIRIKIQTKIINRNILTIKQRADLVSIDPKLKQVIHKKYKTMLTNARQLVRECKFTHPDNTSYSVSDIDNTAYRIVTYCISDLGMSKSEYVDTCKKVRGNIVLIYNLINKGVLNKSIQLAMTLYKNSVLSELTNDKDEFVYNNLKSLLFTRNYTPIAIEQLLTKALQDRVKQSTNPKYVEHLKNMLFNN